MKKQRWLLLLAVICLMVSMIPMVASAAGVDGWQDNGDGTRSYYQNEQMVTNAVIEVEGGYFGFDANGIMYDAMEFEIDGICYRAKEGGALYVNEWYKSEEYDVWYYYGAEGKAQQDFEEIDGVWYYFYGDGSMAQDAAVYSYEYNNYYAINKSGTNSILLNAEGWNKAFNNWYYIVEGELVSYEVLKIGNTYYGFDWDGAMYEDCTFWCKGYEYRAAADGTLYVNRWYEDKDNEIWYYYGADGKAAQDFVKIGNTWYYFYGDGSMAQDTVVYSNEYEKYYIISESGAGNVELQEGWNSAFGSWYYAYNNGDNLICATEQLMEIGGSLYWFYWDGKMAENEMFYCYELGRNAIATASGAVLETGWAKIDGEWYYADGYALYENGVYEIDGNYYYFRDCQLYNIPGEYDDYYVGAQGVLYRNKWRYDSTGYEYDIGWVYYGEYASKVYGLQTIDGVNYYFGNGLMQTNVVRETGDGVYIFGADGKGYKANGWFKHPENGEWMYADNGYLAEGVVTLADGTYAFSNGYMVNKSYYYAYNYETYEYECFLFDASGKKITTPGWKAMGGQWYYIVDASGKLATGWFASGNNQFYLNPYMMNNTVFYDEENDCYYEADNEGVTTKLSGNGWKQLRWGRIYLENNVPVINAWRYLQGGWYYFDYSGGIYRDGVYSVGDKYYVFNQDGRLVTGWYYNYGDWYYADAEGIVVTGMKTIDGKQYIFADSGWMYYGDIYYYEGEQYWIGADGSVLAKVKEGWNEVNSEWYYVQDGYLLRNCLFKDNGVLYGFGSDGAMCTNGIHYAYYDYYMFDASGKVLTGWQFIDGKWHYADPESGDPYIYWDGICWIDDERYYFEQGSLCTGKFFRYNECIITNSDGVVTDIVEVQDGWNYTGSGYLYLKDGRPYTGWVGDYYIQEGEMLFETKFEYDGKYYYLNAEGRYVRNGWYETIFGQYVYAKADGSLYCSEWLKLGGKYYYFSDAYMVAGEIHTINGEAHEFSKDGVWLGEVTYEVNEYASMSDGWKKIGGKWYYYHANTRVFGTRYINGEWYAFAGEDGAMVTNDVYGSYYYGADGTRAEIAGWHYIKGYWMYFTTNHTTYEGWIKSGNGWYYTSYQYDEDAERSYNVMVTNTVIISGNQLYHFGASGYCSGPVKQNGWYYAEGNWYYLKNGCVLTDTACKIDGKLYFFNYDGAMLTNDYAYVEIAGSYGYKYFGADGVAVETAGWKLLTYAYDDEEQYSFWIYIGADGFLYEDGIYTIGGTKYAFRYIFMA